MSENFLWKRPIAITDLETTGLSPEHHEIIEIALLLVSPESLTVLDSWEAKVRAHHLSTADPVALKVNQYREEEWSDSVSLRDALGEYARRTRDAVLLAHNVSFDWSFLIAASDKTGIPLSLHYHRLDLLSIAYAILHGNKEVGSMRLTDLANYFHVINPQPHRAMGDTFTAFEVLKKLLALRGNVTHSSSR